MRNSNTPRPTLSDRPKTPYTKPRLVTYGNIREVTKVTGGVVGMNDGGNGKDKTG